jgi:hypothetical protein
MYNFELINKTFKPQEVSLKLISPKNSMIKMVNGSSVNQIFLEEGGIVKGTFYVIVNQKDIKTNNTLIEFEIISNGESMEHIQTNFVGPVYNFK